MRVRYDYTGVDREGFAAHDPFLDAAPHHGLEQLAQEIALAKTAVAVLGEGRMIRDINVEPQAAEPAVRQIEVGLLAEPTLRANAEAVADNEHPDHQLRIDRRPTRLAVIRLQMPPNLRKVDEPVDLAKQVIVGDMPLEAEAVEQRLLHHRRSPIIGRSSRAPAEENQASRHLNQAEFFNAYRREADIEIGSSGATRLRDRQRRPQDAVSSDQV